jgi:flavin reductase (DIM6/NTAB) family NADH-FMN oxidoreductase RutF
MMEKVDLGSQGFIYPMPVTLFGADLESGPNFKPVAWVTRVQPNPPRLAAGLNKSHATTGAIRRHGEFSICFPSVDMVAVTDWCGLHSANKGVDKAAPFTIFRGALEHAPMIAECPLCLECRVYTVVDLGSHDLVVADIVGTWTEERFLSDGKPDIRKLRPFTLTMPDNNYWAVGQHVGDAWSAGRDYQP